MSWSQLRRLIQTRRVTVNHSLCMDEGRRLFVGDTVRLLGESLPPISPDQVRLRHVDEQLIIVYKPPRMLTLRHRAERHFPPRRKAQQPTLDEILPQLLLEREGRRAARGHRRPRLYCVHRIDRDTSGLLVFARDEGTQKALIEKFARHDVGRVYLAIVPGHVAAQTIASNLVRDRGDGLRGSAADAEQGQRAVTHLQPVETLGDYTLLECRLETGRTHQIRIHLAELGHPICGDPVYRAVFGKPPIEDRSGAPRLALHAAKLQLIHPVSGASIDCESPLPEDLSRFVDRLRSASQTA
ncbi:MAG: RluA family pseudouridine synthase [Pirellulaceae bacterium]|nr:RluA family pseudouridine synthase [Pirellulaceae bacterium]